MGLIVSDKGGYTPVAQGTYLARCYGWIDLGTQESNFGGKLKKQRKLRILFELPTELDEEGKPETISQNYTAILSKDANLRRDLESWRGRAFTPAELEAFDIDNVIGKPCMVTIKHVERNGKTYADITAVTSVMKGTVVPPQITPTMTFNTEKWDQSAYAALPEYLQKWIAKSPEGQAALQGQPQGQLATAPSTVSGDIPF